MQGAVRQAGAQSGRVDAIRALRDAGFTGLIAFAVLLPLIGFLTGVDGSNQLVLTTRWPLLFAVVAVVAACRFLYCFTLMPWLARRAQRPAPAAALANSSMKLRGILAKWFIPAAIGFFVAYPLIIYFAVGAGGGQKWIDNFGIQILIYVMLGWGLNIVVGLAGLLDLGYVAFYAVGAYSYARLPAYCPRSGAFCSASRCCGCAATTSPSSRSPSAKSSG
jgi:branched-chain amino acid transport system permease protein